MSRVPTERVSVPGGRIVLRGERAEDRQALLGWVEPLIREGRGQAERLGLAGGWVFAKGGPLSGSGSRRHALRRWLLGLRPPRMRELDNLTWLERRLFRVPHPRAAAVLWRAGSPRYQALITDWLPEHPTLDTFWPAAPHAEREAVLAELGREVARLHALGFVHRDLFARNVLVGPPDLPRRVAFVDAWAGGPGPGRRGAAYDLGALFLDGPWLAPEWTARFVQAYGTERDHQERPTPKGLFDAARRERARLRSRLEREPLRLAGAPLPPAEWVVDQNPTSQPT